MNPVQKHTTLLSLYVAQSVPMSFFSTVLPVIMRMENYSLESIGLMQLIKIPWILKFFWAPLVDRNAGKKHGYKSWIIASELFYAVVIISIGFFSLATDFKTIVVLMIAAFFLSATQDIASDALAIKILLKSQRSMGNSMQSSGSFLGTLFGSGVLLILYPSLGWQGIMFLLSGIVLIALVPMILNVKNASTLAPVDATPANWRDVFTFFRSSIVVRRILFLMIYYSGILGILVMLKPYLVDLGYEIKKIGFIAGIYGTGIGAACAFLSGFIIRRIGNRKAVFVMAGYSFLTALYFSSFMIHMPHPLVIYIGVALLWSSYAMSSVVVYTVSMNLVRPGREGTDYSIQIVVTHLSGLLMAVLSGFIAERINYAGFFGMEATWAFMVLIFSSLLYKEHGDPELWELWTSGERKLSWKWIRK
ncbi:MAG: MFS transporter [Bacteroidales bacterium]|nr:MFS transporter [Bacteroidales bacterium]